jgi:hypothetical protein
MHKVVKIEQGINRYLTRSYIMVAFLCNSMFNPMTVFSASQVKIPKFDTIIMSLEVIGGLSG